MSLEDRDSMRQTGNRPPSRARGRGGIDIDTGLLLGIVLVGVGLAALLMKGFKDPPAVEDDPFYNEVAYFNPEFEGDYPRLDVNTATRDELLLLRPWISERIADGIIARRPFRISEELLEVRGVGEINIEMLRMYLYGFDDLPDPTPTRRLGIPDA